MGQVDRAPSAVFEGLRPGPLLSQERLSERESREHGQTKERWLMGDWAVHLAGESR